MLAPRSRATLDRVLTSMFWLPPPQEQEVAPESAEVLFAELATESVEDIAIWLQEERALPAAAAEDIAHRCRR